MRAVFLEIPERILAERHALGHDKADEMWEGVLHMVPPASGPHQGLGTKLLLVLGPIAGRRGLEPRYETGLFAPGRDDDYRIPDHTYTRPALLTKRGIDGDAEIVVEIRSPDDESYEKLDFYGRLGVGEVLIVHPDTRAVELFRNHDGRMLLAEPDSDGAVRSGPLDCSFRTVDGPNLRITWEDGEADV